jgi:hypothetical protein
MKPKLHAAYVAGFFDGEGCVYGMTTKPFCNWNLQISQNEREVLDAILETFPGGHVYRAPLQRHPHTGKTYGPNHRLNYTGYKAIPIAEAMLPYSIVKHDALVAYLERANAKHPEPHPYRGPGTYLPNTGQIGQSFPTPDWDAVNHLPVL